MCFLTCFEHQEGQTWSSKSGVHKLHGIKKRSWIHWNQNQLYWWKNRATRVFASVTPHGTSWYRLALTLNWLFSASEKCFSNSEVAPCWCQWLISLHVFTFRQMIADRSGHDLPVCLTLAGKWRGWWWRARKGQRRGREWWSLRPHPIGQFDRSASKAWLHHLPVCLGYRQDAEETEIERKRKICKC